MVARLGCAFLSGRHVMQTMKGHRPAPAAYMPNASPAECPTLMTLTHMIADMASAPRSCGKQCCFHGGYSSGLRVLLHL